METQRRLAVILKRELDAHAVSFVSSEDAPDEDEKTLIADLGRGRTLVVSFAAPLLEASSKREKLAALVESFAELFAEITVETHRPRPDPAEALNAELSALTGRAGALAAIVIDAASPVIWGASEAPSHTDDPETEARIAEVFTRTHEAGISWLELLLRPPTAPTPVDRPERKAIEEAAVRPLRLVPAIDELGPLAPSDREEISRRSHLVRLAIKRIRKNPLLAELHRGEHLHEVVREEGLGYLARSFATIYVLTLVYKGPFDELGAERAVIRALPTIERLVVALPPDDSPTHRAGAVVALRSRRRR